MRKLFLILAAFGLFTVHPAHARGQESQTHADFRGEGERFKASCEGLTFAKFFGCADLLFTDHPLHIAVALLLRRRHRRWRCLRGALHAQRALATKLGRGRRRVRQWIVARRILL